ncbi:MAG: methyltransferase domain-containing protein [Thermoplasmata archaeon]
MSLRPEETDFWKKRLHLQMEESRFYRQLVYEKALVGTRKRILDIGCGTGSTLQDMLSYAARESFITGLDIDEAKLRIASGLLGSKVSFVRADATSLPFKDSTFDLVTFSYVLLFIKDKEATMREMYRVTQKGGAVLAVMEPDYSGALYFPEQELLDKVMIASLAEEGVDLEAGRKLRFLFTKAGLKTEVGIESRGEYIIPNSQHIISKRFEESYWLYEKYLLKTGMESDKIKEYLAEYKSKILSGQYFVFTPVFWALGIKE